MQTTILALPYPVNPQHLKEGVYSDAICNVKHGDGIPLELWGVRRGPKSQTSCHFGPDYVVTWGLANNKRHEVKSYVCDGPATRQLRGAC